MIYLKLQSNKILKVNQSASIYEGENLADIIKINLADFFVYEGWQCYLHILSTMSKVADFYPVHDNEELAIDDKFLTENQDLIIWIEARKEECVMKSSEVKIKVNKHQKIEDVVSDIEITAFEQIMREANDLYQNTLKTKEEIENLIGGIENVPDIEEINKKLEELNQLKIELEESLTKIDSIPKKLSELYNDMNFITFEDIPTKISAFQNDVGYITQGELPTKISDLENDANYLSPDNLTPEIVEELKASLNQEVISF